MARYGQNYFVAATDSNSGVVLYSSLNAGTSFSATQVTSGPVMNGTEMTMCSDGQGSLYIFWENQNDDKMYYATASASSGSITKSATALPGSYSWMDQPSCAMESGNVYVLYRAHDGSAINLYYTKLGSGAVLSSQTQVTNNSTQEDGGRIAVSNGVIYVTYADMYASNNINLVKSTNNFANPVRVNKTVGKIYSYGHELTVDSTRSKIVVAYSDSTSDYEGDMVVAVGDLQGSSFSYASPSSSTYRNQFTPKLLWSSGKLVVAWTDGRNNNYDVYAALSNDGGLTFQQDYNLTNESGEQSLRGLTDSAVGNDDVYFTATNNDSSPTVKAYFYKSSALAVASLTGLSVSGSSSVNANGSAQFSANASYSDSTSKSVSPTWSVSGSAAGISSSGLLTAYSVYSDTSVTVTASYTENGVTKTATQSVTIRAAISTDDHGNSTGSATTVQPVSSTGGYIETNGDNDYFRIDVPSSGSLTISTVGSSDTYGYLPGGSGQLLGENDDSDAVGNFSITQAVGAGTYYAQVRLYGNTGTGAYTLVSSFTPAAPSTPTLTGISASCPSSLNAGASGSCTVSASYSNGASSAVNANWSSSNSAVATMSGSTLIASSSVSSDTSVTVTASYTENGVTKTATQSVTIRAAISTDDHGNSTGSATTVQPVSSTGGHIETNGDNDYFRIDVPSSGSLTISTVGNSDTYGYLLDSNGQIVAENDDASLLEFNFRITRTVTAGTYYARVKFYGADTGAYTLVSSFASTAVTLTGISASCPSSVNAGASVSCTVSASYSNGSSGPVNAAWSSNNTSAVTMSGNTLIASSSVYSETNVTVTASYTESGVTKTVSQNVTINAAGPLLTGISATCPATLDAGASAACSATASYRDGSSMLVTVAWTSSDNSVASITGNTLTANSGVKTDTPVSINASYTENGITKTATVMVAVKAAALTPVKLLISGASSVKSGETASYTATVVYSDSSSKLAGNVTWTASGDGASVDSSGMLTAAKVTADTTVTLTAIYTEGQVTKTADQIVTIKMGGATACNGTDANQSGITIAGNSLKKLGESLDVSYCLKSFNSASKFDIYVAVELPDGKMLFLQTAGFFGTPTFVLYDSKQAPPAKYLANTLIPDKSGSVLSMSVLPLELPSGTYTFYAIPVLAGKDVMSGFNWIGDLAKTEVTLYK